VLESAELKKSRIEKVIALFHGKFSRPEKQRLPHRMLMQ
jgi:hypothetical protein